MLLKRLLLTKNVEMYEIKEELYSDVRFYMVLMDMRRPSVYEDFADILGYVQEDFVGRDNYIKALIIYDVKITEDEKEMTYEIVSGFLEDKDDCDWNMKYIKGDFKKMQVIGVNHEELISQINHILNAEKSSGDMLKIESDSFKYLLQE
ncbi:MAG: hypothetical protein IJE89_06295 [Bacilli bacterium]|nr:hypothetical protein [Bacilli bacterium]